MPSTAPDTSIEKVTDQMSNSELSPDEVKKQPQLNENSKINEEPMHDLDGGEDATTNGSGQNQTKTKQSNDHLINAENDLEKPLTKLEEALQLRDKLDSLIRRTVQTKKRCEKLDHDNKYLQEYVGNLMNSGDFLSKRV